MRLIADLRKGFWAVFTIESFGHNERSLSCPHNVFHGCPRTGCLSWNKYHNLIARLSVKVRHARAQNFPAFPFGADNYKLICLRIERERSHHALSFHGTNLLKDKGSITTNREFQQIAFNKF